MIKKTLKGLIFILFIFNGLSIYAQYSLNCIGVDITGIGGNVSMSCGQVFTSNLSNDTFFFIEGIQQTFESSKSNMFVNKYSNKLKVYPNPTNKIIFIQTEVEFNSHFFLYDSKGQIVKYGNIGNIEKSINIENLSSGIYILKIINNKTSQSINVLKQ